MTRCTAGRSVPIIAAAAANPAESLMIVQQHGCGPPESQAHPQRADLDQYVAREQDVEEPLQVQPELRHALRSGISWLSSRRFGP